MRRLLLIFILLTSCFSGRAQVYANEWINHSNRYFKFPVYQTGFYRIDSTSLANSGIPLNAVNPKNLQLFIQGKEEYIYIQGEADNVFNSGDYLEFFYERSNATFDSSFYTGISYQPNPYVSLFKPKKFIPANCITTLFKVMPTEPVIPIILRLRASVPVFPMARTFQLHFLL
jgi:hypothetical protein